MKSLCLNKISKNSLIFFLSTLTLLTILSENVLAARSSSLTRAGDIMQITNPILAGVISSQEKGLGHFSIVYGESLAIMGTSKLIGKSSRLAVSKRPSRSGKRARFDGFPSGHTTSAWTAASYVRVFSDDHKMMAIPLYAAAVITGYSRVKARQHTVTQVVMAAALSESVTMINQKMNWSNEYRSSEIGFSPDGFMARLKINF